MLLSARRRNATGSRDGLLAHRERILGLVITDDKVLEQKAGINTRGECRRGAGKPWSWWEEME